MAHAQGDAGPAGQGTPEYRSARVLALGASRWLGIQAVLAAVILFLDVRQHALLSGVPPYPASADTLGTVNITLTLVQLVFYLISIVLVIAWLHRAYGQLPALGLRGLRHGRGWAIGSWFVPLLNLVRPLEMTNDVWRSGADAPNAAVRNWHQRPISPLLGFWWAAWLLSGVVFNVSLRAETDTTEGLRISLATDAVAQALAALAGVLLILVIRRATARQDRRAAKLASGAQAVAA